LANAACFDALRAKQLRKSASVFCSKAVARFADASSLPPLASAV